MKLVACLKWVDLRPEIDPLSGAVSTDDRFSGASPADLAALEWALRLADAHEGQVTAVTFGPPAAEPMLRDALAIGATSAVLIDDGGRPHPASSGAVAAQLAAACTDADLVCCGLHSVDRGSGAVPAFLAAELGIPQALGLVSVDGFGERGPSKATTSAILVVERRLDHGRRERLQVTGRCVLSFEGGLEPRRASLTATLAATSTAIERIEAIADASGVVSTRSDRGLTVVATGPYRPRAKVKPAPTGPTHERIASLTAAGTTTVGEATVRELDPSTAAEVVVERLVAWGYLEPRSPGEAGDLSDAPVPADTDS